MNHNFTRTSAPSPEEQAARLTFFEQSMRDADRINAEFMLAKSQQDAAEFQNRLVEATQLSVEQLIAIRGWLKHNS
jgi:hypothetical protein